MAVTTRCVTGHSGTLPPTPILCKMLRNSAFKASNGEVLMKTTRHAIVLAVVLGSILMADAVQAGDVKGKVSADGIEVGGKHCCLH